VQVAKGRIKYQQFVPSVRRSFTYRPDEAESPNENLDDTMEREPKKLRTATDKGALWHEYDFLVHQFVTHLRHVHPANKDIMMEIVPSAGKSIGLGSRSIGETGICALLHSQQNKPVQRCLLPLLGHCHDSIALQYLPVDGCHMPEIFG
jgi:hypothetical protein